MVTIRQHGDTNNLFDISCFLEDVDAFYDIDSWQINVEYCMGERATEIEQMSANSVTLQNAEFRSLYSGIYQTVDGSFIGLRSNSKQLELLAVDSSFWEVSGTVEFESHMLAKYGKHQYVGT